VCGLYGELFLCIKEEEGDVKAVVETVRDAAGEKNMKRSVERRKGTDSIFAVVLCVICFFVIPVIGMQFERETDGWFGMAEFFEFVFWPMAGMGISAFYAAQVKRKEVWMLVPVCTAVCLAGINILEERTSWVFSFVCLIFEVIWYEVISFWGRMGE